MSLVPLWLGSIVSAGWAPHPIESRAEEVLGERLLPQLLLYNERHTRVGSLPNAMPQRWLPLQRPHFDINLGSTGHSFDFPEAQLSRVSGERFLLTGSF